MKVDFKTLAAIYRLANHVAASDGNAVDEEFDQMASFFGLFNIDLDTFKELVSYGQNSLSDREAISLVAALDAEGKQKVVNLFAKVAVADQKLTEEEKSMFFQISEYCGLPDPDLESEGESASQPESTPEEEEEEIVPAFLIVNFYGIASVCQSNNTEWSALGQEVSQWLGSDGVEFVRYTKALNAISQELNLNNRHLVFMIGKNYGNKTVGDNMPATILYGGGYPLYGNIAFAIETDGDYKVEGIRTKSLLNEIFQVVNKYVDGLIRTQ